MDVLSRRKSLKGTGILDGRAMPLAEHADTLNESARTCEFQSAGARLAELFRVGHGREFFGRDDGQAFMCWRSKRNSSRNRFKDIRSIMVAGTLGLLGHARPSTQE